MRINTKDSADVRRRCHREALNNADVVRYTVSLALAVTAEWSVFLGVLVYAFDDGGATSSGLASAAMLSSYVVAAPFAGRLTHRYRPHRVRLAGLFAQSLGYGAAVACAVAGMATPFVVVPCMFALAAVTTLRPSGAVLLPAMVRSSDELTVANLWAGYCESASVLLGPAFSTLLLHLWGAAATVGGSAVLSFVAMAVAAVRPPANPPAASGVREPIGALSLMIANLRSLRARPGALGVLTVTGGQYFLVGSLDLIVVVIAEDQLGLGDTGPGLLITAFGVGALLSGFATTTLARRRRLAPVLIAAMVVTAVGVAALGASLSLVVALTALPVVGLTRSVLDGIGRILLQRSAPPAILPSMFAGLELSCGAGLLAGSIVAQSLIAIGGPPAALWGTAAYFVVLLIVTQRSLHAADDTADVPVVAMSLLRRQPIFADMQPPELEAVARSSTERTVSAGQVICREGEDGDRFYAIADGSFDVTIGGVCVATLDAHAGSFGEVALVAGIARSATVTAATPGALVAVDRAPFLAAITANEAVHQTAWRGIHALDVGLEPPSNTADGKFSLGGLATSDPMNRLLIAGGVQEAM